MFRKSALARIAVFCLGTSALIVPALSASFSVGGGTINTTLADGSSDSTGTGGGFLLWPNNTGNNDTVTITNVTINNSSGVPNGRALDLGYALPSIGSYSVVMHGSSLTSAVGSGYSAFFQVTNSSGNVAFDSIGGSANTISGPIGVALSSNGGSVSIQTGADTITTSGATGEILYATTTGIGTIAIDTVGATLASAGTYGISAVSGGSGAITIGGRNGGIASNITVNGGYGIYASSVNSIINVTLASTGSIVALNGIKLQGGATTVDSSGTINATANAIDAALASSLALNLRSGSSTSGIVLGSSNVDIFNLFGGANVVNATFNGGGGNDTLNLTGSGNGSFAVTSASNIQAFQKSGIGTWTLTGTTTNVTAWTISAGTLAISNPAALGASSGSLAFNGGTLRATANGTITNDILFSDGSIDTISAASGQTLTLNGLWNLGGATNATAVFGSPTDTGTVALAPALFVNPTIVPSDSVEVAGGTLQAKMYAVSRLASVRVDAGATLDFSGVQPTGDPIFNLLGAGTVITNAVTPLVLGQGVFSGRITGAGQVQVGAICFGLIGGPGGCSAATTGAVLLSGANDYSGGTSIPGGIIQIGNMAALGTGPVTLGAMGRLSSVVIGTLTNDISLANGATGTLSAAPGQILTLGGGNFSLGTSGMIIFGTVADTGSVIFQPSAVTAGLLTSVSVDAGTLRVGNSRFNALVAPGFGLFVNTGATLDLNGFPTAVNALSGGGQIQTGGATLSVVDGRFFSGAIAGTGAFHQLADAPPVPSPTGGTRAGFVGMSTFTGTNTYTGGTIIDSGGILQLGNGGTSGSIIGNVANNGTLAVNRSDSYSLNGAISGSGAFQQLGSGTAILAGANSYTGGTTVSAGTLNVIGSIASSSVAVASGATLTGTGKVGATTVASGGALNPGSSTTPGTLSVGGNLTLASGSNYLDAVTPTAAGLASVSGTASINGNFIASLASGVYTPGQRYTVLTASGGISGIFASTTTSGIPTYVKGRLSYDASNVYLNLDPVALAPSLSNATATQLTAVSAIDAAVTGGAAPSVGFAALYGLSGTALNHALDQISGQAAPNVINAVGQGFLSFLSMTGQGGGDSGSFAPGSAYGAADAPHRAQLAPGATRIWGAAYGGHVGLSADAASGAAGLSASNVGMIGGADVELDDGFLVGLTAGLGRQNFTSGNGTGDSDDLTIGAYARKDVGPFYVSGAFGYGRHQITTLRVVTVSGTDVLQGKEDADDVGGRVEAGWHTALDDQYALIPYIAVAAESFQTPAYGETALSGASTFALSFASHASTLGRSELGARVARNYETENGTLSAGVQAAWAHQLDDAPLTQASFQGLPGASFAVSGVRAAGDTAMLGGDLQFQNRSGLFFGVQAQTQLGPGTTIVQGMGHLGWRW